MLSLVNRRPSLIFDRVSLIAAGEGNVQILHPYGPDQLSDSMEIIPGVSRGFLLEELAKARPAPAPLRGLISATDVHPRRCFLSVFVVYRSWWSLLVMLLVFVVSLFCSTLLGLGSPFELLNWSNQQARPLWSPTCYLVDGGNINCLWG